MEAEVGMKGPEGRYCMFMLTPPTASGVAAVATLSGLMFRVLIPVLGRVASATLVWFLSPLVGVWRVLVKWSWVYQDWLWG